MKKEKTVRTYQRRTKSGKTTTVKQHTAKYDAADMARDIVKKAGAGAELEKVKKAKAEASIYEGFDFTPAEFAEWYEGTGSKTDKKVEKALKKKLGSKGYNELNNAAAEGYKKGGADKFFRKEVSSAKDSAPKETSAPKEPKGKAPKPTAKSTHAESVQTAKDFNSRQLDKTEGGKLLKQMGFKKDGVAPSYTKKVGNVETTVSYGSAGWQVNTMKLGSGKPMLYRADSSSKVTKEKPSKESKGKKTKEETPALKDNATKSDKGTFSFTENTGGKKPMTFKYEAKFVTDKKGKTKMMVRDSEVKGSKFVDASHEGYNKLADFPASVQKVAKEKGLTFKNGEWVSASLDKNAKKAKSLEKKFKRNREKNTPEQNQALEATLAEIRERNRQPYQVSR